MPTSQRRTRFSASWHLSTSDAIAYFDKFGLDTSKTSYEIQNELAAEFRCVIPKGAVALVAILTGHICIPCRDGKSFTFTKLE